MTGVSCRVLELNWQTTNHQRASDISISFSLVVASSCGTFTEAELSTFLICVVLLWCLTDSARGIATMDFTLDKKLQGFRQIAQEKLQSILCSIPDNQKDLVIEPALIKPLEHVCGASWLR